MILIALTLLITGICLSAFFSGSETGFYRASRLRIMMDAMQGDKLSHRMLYLTNHPPLFVATALVGNNTANYLTSLAIVLLSKALLGSGPMIEATASLFFAPVVFVYGELMPKNLFYQAPNFLLRIASRWFLVFAVLFAPISAVLWSLGRLLERLFGQSPSKVRLALARKDLGDVFMEGQHAGILHPTQLQLAQNFFLVATRPVFQSMTPLARTAVIPRSATRFEALRLAQRLKMTEIAVANESTGELAGYLRTAELIVNEQSASLAKYLNPLPDLPARELHGEAIMQLQASGELMARVVDDRQRTLGVVTLDALTSPLLGGSLSALHGPPATTDFPVDIQAT